MLKALTKDSSSTQHSIREEKSKPDLHLSTSTS